MYHVVVERACNADQLLRGRALPSDVVHCVVLQACCGYAASLRQGIRDTGQMEMCTAFRMCFVQGWPSTNGRAFCHVVRPWRAICIAVVRAAVAWAVEGPVPLDAQQ